MYSGRIALERLAAIDRAVRAGEYPNAGSIALRLEVCRRTIQRDIDFLRDRLGAPLAYVPARRGYAYTDPGYRLPALSLTEGELVALFLAERVLQQYRGTPYAPDLARAFAKITAGLSGEVTVDLGHLGEAYSFRASARVDHEPGVLRDLGAAVLGRRRLRLRYYSASRDEEAERLVDPYHLASVDGQWYLAAHCHTRGEVRLFAPARIRSLEPTGETFERPSGFRIDEYLGLSLAVMRGGPGEVHRVRLLFRGEAVRYVRERRWHPSQRTEATADGGLLVELELSHLREVERWALSWGADCEVIGPADLRDRVSIQADGIRRHYRRRPRRPDRR